MGVVVSIYARSLFHYADLTAEAGLEHISSPADVASCLDGYALSVIPKAIFVHRKDGAIVALWATFFDDPVVSRAPYVRVPQRRIQHKATYLKKLA